MYKKRITNIEFRGIIKPGEDPKNRGRYKVFIPELMENMEDPEQAVLYCVNHVHKYRDNHNEENIEGQYFPLHSGTKVIVKFFEEDFQTGYIDRVVGDYYEDSLPLELVTSERDKYYQLLRTVANDLIAITQDTDTIPKNGIHIYNKNGDDHENIIVLDFEGIHIYSKSNYDQQIELDSHINIGGTFHLIVKNDMLIQAENCDITATGKVNINASSCDMKITGPCDIKSDGICNIDASTVNLNCKLGLPKTTNKPTPAYKTKLIDMNNRKDNKVLA